jgi:hypothetical protein
VLERISFSLHRRDEVPNQELARSLAGSRDSRGIAECAQNLWNPNRAIRSDCLKVLYEIGYLAPDLIAPHVEGFLKLLSDRNNRMVWGALIALATIGSLKPTQIWKRIDAVIRATETGSLISLVWGIRTLARVAAAKKEYRERILPKLLGHLESCNPRDVPTHLESMIPALGKSDTGKLLAVVDSRKKEMTSSHLTRLAKVLAKIEAAGA